MSYFFSYWQLHFIKVFNHMERYSDIINFKKHVTKYTESHFNLQYAEALYQSFIYDYLWIVEIKFFIFSYLLVCTF